MVDCSIQLDYDSPNQRIRLKVSFPKGGCYHATVSLAGLQLHNGDFDIIVLESTSKKNTSLFHGIFFLSHSIKHSCISLLFSLLGSVARMVHNNVASKDPDICYAAKLLGMQGERFSKPKKVFCFISPKQLTIKEYLLKFIPKRLVTFRLCPSTKVCNIIRNNFIHIYMYACICIYVCVYVVNLSMQSLVCVISYFSNYFIVPF